VAAAAPGAGAEILNPQWSLPAFPGIRRLVFSFLPASPVCVGILRRSVSGPGAAVNMTGHVDAHFSLVLVPVRTRHPEALTISHCGRTVYAGRSFHGRAQSFYGFVSFVMQCFFQAANHFAAWRPPSVRAGHEGNRGAVLPFAMRGGGGVARKFYNEAKACQRCSLDESFGGTIIGPLAISSPISTVRGGLFDRYRSLTYFSSFSPFFFLSRVTEMVMTRYDRPPVKTDLLDG